MDYLLGILTGIGICLIYGNYLLRRREKREKAKEHPPGTVGVYIDGKFTGATLKSTELSDKPVTEKVSNTTTTFVNETLSEQLQDAIEREDFQEAARLRDLINKK